MSYTTASDFISKNFEARGFTFSYFLGENRIDTTNFKNDLVVISISMSDEKTTNSYIFTEKFDNS